MGVLRVNVGGVWVDVTGGGDEVWVGPDTPPDAASQLWIDTDALSTVGSGGGGGGTDEVWVGPDAPSDLTQELWYDTDDPGLSLPNMPRGWMGHARSPGADQNGITAVVDVTGQTVTFIADASRRYLVTASINVIGALSGAAVFYQIANGANGTLSGASMTLGAASAPLVIFLQYVLVGVTGSYTVKGRVESTTTINVLNSSARNGFIVVQDIGGV